MHILITYPSDGATETVELIPFAAPSIPEIRICATETSARCPARTDYFNMAVNDGKESRGEYRDYASDLAREESVLFTWEVIGSAQEIAE